VRAFLSIPIWLISMAGMAVAFLLTCVAGITGGLAMFIVHWTSRAMNWAFKRPELKKSGVQL